MLIFKWYTTGYAIISLYGIITAMAAKQVPLSNNEFATVDSDDYARIMKIGKWVKNGQGYAVKRYHQKTLRMHQFIMGTPKGLQTDHINRNKLDNRKVNLRIVDANINTHNGEAGGTKSIYPNLPKYVTFDRIRNQFLASRVVRKRFDTVEEAIAFIKGQ